MKIIQWVEHLKHIHMIFAFIVSHSMSKIGHIEKYELSDQSKMDYF